MTVLLTGGSGFLGSHIAEQLSQQGRPVRALVRATSDTRFLRTLEHVELVEAALDDPQALAQAMAGVEAVVHSAGLTKARNSEEFYRVNAQGTKNLLQAAAEAEAPLRRFVLVSSQTVVGPSDAAGTPVTNDAEPHPVTAYGRSKLAAERVALEHQEQLPVTIIRPPAIYGPRDREFLAFFKSVKARVLPYMGPPDSKLSIIYGPDAAAACIKAIDAELPSGTRLLLDDGEVYTQAQLAEAVEAALGRRALIRFSLPRSLLRTAAAATEFVGHATDRAVMFTRDKCNELFEQWVCDGSEARTRLGWQAEVKFAEGARITAAWYQREGWL
jgi:nucleoside-diphosphate-sugar epimerase